MHILTLLDKNLRCSGQVEVAWGRLPFDIGTGHPGQVELKDSYGGKPSGLYSLEPADAAASGKDASMMLQRQATSSKLANLKISAPPGECIVALLDRQQAMLINDGLITIGSSASIGRGDQERMLRILPGVPSPHQGPCPG